MPNYQNGKIYKLVNSETDEIKVGSTTQMLSRRMRGHRTDAKRRDEYKRMNEIGMDKFKIVLLESYPCNNCDELRMREQYYINLLKPALNLQDAYVADPKEKAKEQRKNSPKRKAYEAEYFQKNKEKIYAKRQELKEKRKLASI